MSPTLGTMLDAFKRSVHEILDDNSAVTLMATIGGTFLTNAGAVAFAHFGAKYGLDPALAADIPKGAFWLSCALMGTVCTHLHATGRVNAAAAAAQGAGAPSGSPAFKSELQGLALDAVKAALDQHLPQAIGSALQQATAKAPTPSDAP
jgi:hypothetical protein